MALETLGTFTGHGGAGMQGTGTGTVAKAVRELQGQQFTVTTGAGADTDITVTGIATTDTVAAIINLTDGANVSGTITITAADTIQISTSTAAKTLLVIWYDKP